MALEVIFIGRSGHLLSFAAGAAFAQTGAALRGLVRPCADWCGPAQTGAALRRLVRPWTDWGAIGELSVFGIRKSAIPDRTGAAQLRFAVELTNSRNLATPRRGTPEDATVPTRDLPRRIPLIY